MADKKAFLAVSLSLLIWVVWQKYYMEPIQMAAEKERQRQQELLSKKTAVPKAGEASSTSLPVMSGKEKAPEIKTSAPAMVQSLENSVASMSVSNTAWGIRNWELKSFSTSLDKREEKVTLLENTGFGSQLGLRFSDANLNPAPTQTWSQLEKINSLAVASNFAGPGLSVKRKISLNESGYGGNVSFAINFTGTVPKFVFIDLYGSPKRANDKEGSIFGQAPDKVHVTFRDPNGRHSHMGANLKESLESGTGVKWIGLDTRYFVMAVVPEHGVEAGAQVANDDLDGPAVRGSLVFPTDGKKELNIQAKIFFGPKHMESLTSVDPMLSDAIDFGWTSAIAIPLLQALKWLYSYLHNYGLAIIALTFLIKMLLFPLMYKSMKSMSKMTKLQPQLNALREKHKDDKEKLNQEMMTFMKANGYNPIGGCLPILLQMPIFFALYRVLFNSMELYQAPFIGWIHDLSSPDPFYVTPVLLTGLMYFQQKISPSTAADPAQQKMLQIMPVMFGAFMLMLPSGLTIYMVVNSAVSIGQQWFLNKQLGITKAPVPVKA